VTKEEECVRASLVIAEEWANTFNEWVASKSPTKQQITITISMAAIEILASALAKHDPSSYDGYFDILKASVLARVRGK